VIDRSSHSVGLGFDCDIHFRPGLQLNLIAAGLSKRVFDTEFLVKVVSSLDDNLCSFGLTRKTGLNNLFYSSN
jgi:hypothetical protein